MSKRYTYATTLNWGGDTPTAEIEVEVSYTVAWGSAETGRFGPPENYDPGSADLVEDIRAAETARFAAERLAVLGLAETFHRQLAKKAIRSLKAQYPGDYYLAVLVCDFEGRFICRVDEAEALT